jgi:hypothetical protein
MSTETKKIRLLECYHKWYQQWKINNTSTIAVQHENLCAIHNFMRVLDYFEYWNNLNYGDKLSITENEYNKVGYEVEKAIQLANLTYYA